MCRPKPFLPTWMLSLCIVTSALLSGNASATISATPYYPGTIKPNPASQAVMNQQLTALHKKPTHLPVHHSLSATAAPGPLALMPRAELTLARGFTFKRLLRRRAIG